MLLIAHGGLPHKYPENSLEGFIAAAKFNPFAIEMDIILDSNTKLPICAHPIGVSSEQGLYTKNTKGPIDIVDKPVLLRELFTLIPSNIKVLLDLKEDSEDLIQGIFKEITITYYPRLIIGVRNTQIYKRIKEIDINIETLALFSNPLDYMEYKNLGGKHFRIWEKDVSLELVDLIHAGGLYIWVTPGNKAVGDQPRTAGEISRETFDRMLNLGVDALLVNDIETVSLWNS